MDKKTIIIADNQDITRLGLKTLVRGALKDVEGLDVKELSRRAELIAELKSLQLDTLTPLEAINILYSLKAKADNL